VERVTTPGGNQGTRLVEGISEFSSPLRPPIAVDLVLARRAGLQRA
jgi:hypothetical protein